jgi:hypothetical protein
MSLWDSSYPACEGANDPLRVAGVGSMAAALAPECAQDLPPPRGNVGDQRPGLR